jgi:nitrogen regulatory protein PII-like uncharacterized protein
MSGSVLISDTSRWDVSNTYFQFIFEYVEKHIDTSLCKTVKSELSYAFDTGFFHIDLKGVSHNEFKSFLGALEAAREDLGNSSEALISQEVFEEVQKSFRKLIDLVLADTRSG